MILVEQILTLSHQQNNGVAIYARTKKNSLLLRMRSLHKRNTDEQEHLARLSSATSTFKPMDRPVKRDEIIYDNNLCKTTSILSSMSKPVVRPKKNVKFSDNVALIVPTSDDTEEPPSEHLIHSFLRKIQQQQTSTASDSDSDTPSSSSSSSSNELPIGLSECTLCHKRCSKSNQIGAYCSNCHYYMQRFQPATS